MLIHTPQGVAHRGGHLPAHVSSPSRRAAMLSLKLLGERLQQEGLTDDEVATHLDTIWTYLHTH